MLRLLVTCVAALWANVGLAGALPAFPGAEGEGSETPGGRGGDVYLVTSLEDSGPGSLRAACAAEGPRMVIVNVSGIVELESPIEIRNPFITIAGQAAPGGGICLKNFGLRVRTSDVVIRFLRIRPGNFDDSTSAGIDIGGAARVVIDHCSISWTAGPAIAISREANDVTIQWCLIAETLFDSDGDSGGRGIGLALDGDDATLSIHHNYIAHHNAGSPFINGAASAPGPLIDFRNNVVYDWGERCGDSASNVARYNIIGNVYKAGPSTPEKAMAAILRMNSFESIVAYADNELVGSKSGTANNFFLIRKPEGFRHQAHQHLFRPGNAFEAAPVQTFPTASALKRVLGTAGASKPVRDAADDRIAAQYRLGTGRIIADAAHVNGWPEYATGSAAQDTDADGMPDIWEREKGLDTKDAMDATSDSDGDGYTNIEEFLNSIPPIRGQSR